MNFIFTNSFYDAFKLRFSLPSIYKFIITVLFFTILFRKPEYGISLLAFSLLLLNSIFIGQFVTCLLKKIEFNSDFLFEERFLIGLLFHHALGALFIFCFRDSFWLLIAVEVIIFARGGFAFWLRNVARRNRIPNPVSCWTYLLFFLGLIILCREILFNPFTNAPGGMTASNIHSDLFTLSATVNLIKDIITQGQAHHPFFFFDTSIPNYHFGSYFFAAILNAFGLQNVDSIIKFQVPFSLFLFFLSSICLLHRMKMSPKMFFLWFIFPTLDVFGLETLMPFNLREHLTISPSFAFGLASINMSLILLSKIEAKLRRRDLVIVTLPITWLVFFKFQLFPTAIFAMFSTLILYFPTSVKKKATLCFIASITLATFYYAINFWMSFGFSINVQANLALFDRQFAFLQPILSFAMTDSLYKFIVYLFFRIFCFYNIFGFLLVLLLWKKISQSVRLSKLEVFAIFFGSFAVLSSSLLGPNLSKYGLEDEFINRPFAGASILIFALACKSFHESKTFQKVFLNFSYHFLFLLACMQYGLSLQVGKSPGHGGTFFPTENLLLASQIKDNVRPNSCFLDTEMNADMILPALSQRYSCIIRSDSTGTIKLSDSYRDLLNNVDIFNRTKDTKILMNLCHEQNISWLVLPFKTSQLIASETQAVWCGQLRCLVKLR